MTNKRPDVSFIFQITDRVLWNVFKKNEIGDVMLPFVVLRRLDCILEPVNKKVRSAYLDFKDKVDDEKLTPILKKAAGGLQFYNTSQHTLSSILDSPKTTEIDFNNYINGYNEGVRHILENFQFDKIKSRLIKNNLLYEMIDAICEVDLHPDKVDNHDMGYIFEELIRISNEQSNETAGEHFTPRDVINLMVKIMFSTEKEDLTKPGIIRTLYDPALGTGGTVNLGKKYILDELTAGCEHQPEIKTYGQEINEQSYAIAKSESLITGEDANNIRHGNTFIDDQFPDKHFHYQLANPPYGVTWKKDSKFIKQEATNPAGRFYAGTPRTSDGQFLFMQHMISKMEREGGKIAVVTNGSPLFTGAAGSGESDIRKWIITNDWLDCIVALPNDLFYNTGINTYIWFLNNNKPAHRKGKLQLINANQKDEKYQGIEGFCQQKDKSLGNKRNEITDAHSDKILDIYTAYEENEHCKIFDNEFFGYYYITVEQPEIDEETNQPKTNSKGELVADSSKRDRETIPLSEDVEQYFEREVLPHVPDAWIDFDKTRIGYEINFTKYFYEYTPLRPAQQIKVEIEAIEEDITKLMQELLN